MNSNRRVLTAWTGLVLLAVNLIAGALVPAQAASPAGALPQQAYICTAFGLKAVGGESEDSQGTAQNALHAAFCVYCLPLLQGGLDAPPTALPIAIPYPVAQPFHFPQDRDAIIRPLSGHHPAQPRAPPVS